MSHLLGPQQRHREAKRAEAARAADAVQVGGKRARRLEVQHLGGGDRRRSAVSRGGHWGGHWGGLASGGYQVDAPKVDAARQQVGAHEEAKLEGVHLSHLVQAEVSVPRMVVCSFVWEV